MLTEVPVGQKTLADYTHILGKGLIEQIKDLAEPLKGKRVLHVSATAFGGGVSEILYTMIPLTASVSTRTGTRSSARRSSSTSRS